jgi:hypothetical protein
MGRDAAFHPGPAGVSTGSNLHTAEDLMLQQCPGRNKSTTRVAQIELSAVEELIAPFLSTSPTSHMSQQLATACCTGL